MEKGTGLSKSGGLHLRTFALPRSVSCSRSAPPPIRKLRAASQTDVLSAGDSGCWDSACMRPHFGSRPPVSTPDPPSLRLALPPPPRAARAWGSSSAALPASLQIGVLISHPCLWRDNEPATCTRGSSARVCAHTTMPRQPPATELQERCQVGRRFWLLVSAPARGNDKRHKSC